MTIRFGREALLPGMLTLALLGCTSCIYVEGYDGGERASYRKNIPLSAPLEPGSAFAADTDDGSITLEGTQTNECRLDATIVTHARTEELAEELAEQIDVRLEPDGEGLRVAVDRPSVIRNAWFSVSLRGSLPTQTHLTLSTSDGSLEVQDIEGDIRLRTSDGKITGSRVKSPTFICRTSDGPIQLSDVTAGSLEAETSDGSITLENIRADTAAVRTLDGSIRWQDAAVARIECHSSDGAINIECTPDSPKAPDIRITASDGGITLVTPPELSAQIDASTNDGSINTDLPITIRGKVDKSLRGKIGGGEGQIYLRTGSGIHHDSLETRLKEMIA